MRSFRRRRKGSFSLPERRHANRRATIVDVARASGFSASTVSIVLNEAPLSRYVATGTKERIRAVAGDLGYRPDASARSLRSRRSHTIGIMVSDISDPFCTLILQGIEKALQPTTYLPVIMIAHNRRETFERHIEMMLERRVEGLVLVANWLFGEFDLLADIEKNQIPTFGVGRDLTASGIRSLQVDNEAGGYAAVKHLFDLGHREIVVLRGPSELSDSDRRWQGIQRFAGEVRTIAPYSPRRAARAGRRSDLRLRGGLPAGCRDDPARSQVHRGACLRRSHRSWGNSCSAPGRPAGSRRLLGDRLRRCASRGTEHSRSHHHPPTDGADGESRGRVGACLAELSTGRRREPYAERHVASLAARAGCPRILSIQRLMSLAVLVRGFFRLTAKT